MAAAHRINDVRHAMRMQPLILLVYAELLEDGGLVQDRLCTKDSLDAAIDIQNSGSAKLFECIVINLGRIFHPNAQAGNARIHILDILGTAQCLDDHFRIIGKVAFGRSLRLFNRRCLLIATGCLDIEFGNQEAEG